MILSSITDIPRSVSRGDEDVFGIEPFEKGLTSFIDATSTPITIALQGEWGSGKTSLMNSLHENLCVNGEFHSVWINTWEYALMKDAKSTLFDIISGLVKEVNRIADVDKSVKESLQKKIYRIGEVVAKFAMKTAADKMVSGASEIVDELTKEIEEKSTISEIRNELEEIIEKCIKNDNKKGFLFFIDDLDRIDPPVAVELLELLKNLFNLNNCVFILAIDYDVVIKGLEPKYGKFTENNEREFRSFFDKIIQVPFTMPIGNYEVNKFLTSGLINTGYLTEAQANDENLINKFSDISILSVGTNPRALKRLLNSLSLISFINKAKNINSEENDLYNEIDLLVNFSLVAIQIAYPPIYKVLAVLPNYFSWDENTAMQYSLKQLDEATIERLNKLKEFDEDWEKVVYRLCERDFYLRKKILNVSQLLNKLKMYIKESGEGLEEMISSVIKLSSVTSLNAEEPQQEVQDYHRGSFLKHLRHLLIPKLRDRLPEIANLIQYQGKRVQSNAFIKFSKDDWVHFIRLHSYPYQGKVCLIIFTEKWMCGVLNTSDIHQRFEALNIQNQMKSVEQDYNEYINNHPEFEFSGLYENVARREGIYVTDMYAYYILPKIEDFYQERHLNTIADLIKDLYPILVRMESLREWSLDKEIVE